mmetsp:Transcript_28837/g.60593  ORF Transcript_28837/g.60593 Transcript_28837/m.60593 type:complete len:218 (+) Transcript_28837:750-1403(+)
MTPLFRAPAAARWTAGCTSQSGRRSRHGRRYTTATARPWCTRRRSSATHRRRTARCCLTGYGSRRSHAQAARHATSTHTAATESRCGYAHTRASTASGPRPKRRSGSSSTSLTRSTATRRRASTRSRTPPPRQPRPRCCRWPDGPPSLRWLSSSPRSTPGRPSPPGGGRGAPTGIASSTEKQRNKRLRDAKCRCIADGRDEKIRLIIAPHFDLSLWL